MTRRQGRRETFADVVARAAATPPAAAPTRPPGPGPRPDGTLADRAGRVHHPLGARLTPDRARELVAAGAVLAWDPCGCGGHCGLTWVAPADAARLAAAGPPRVRATKRNASALWHWRAADGTDLVLAVDDVRWGDALA